MRHTTPHTTTRGAGALLASAELPGVGNIVEQVASSVTVEDDGAGGEHLVILMPLTA